MKEIFENYSEKPSEDVWRRLNERLEAEMPVSPARKAVWKWVAAAVGVIALSGGVAFGVMRHQGKEAASPAVVEETRLGTSQKEETLPVVVEETASIATEEALPDAARQREEPAAVVEAPRPGTPASTETPTASEATETPKSNVRQIVLPANSTLAKQLAADPVLRTISPDEVDWSMPIHLSIPNLFTPNGDGVNDLFVIEGIEQYSSPKLVIRDKNNRVVYKSEPYRNNWGGGDCPEGAYNYEFTFFYNGIENQATGKVRIIRS